MDWLDELHDKLWGRADLFHQVFRAVDLTKDDFVELQSDLHHLNPSRNCKSYISKKFLETKMNLLRSRTATRPLTITTDTLVPKVVLQASEGVIPANAMYVNDDTNLERIIKRQEDHKDKGIDDENAKGDVDDDDAKGDENDQHSESENVDEDDKLYIDEDAAMLSQGPTPVLPCTIRFMDLTCLNLQHFDRMPQVLLIRDEWDAVIDIFNQRRTGKRGGAILTGQPGIGKRHYSRGSVFATNSSLKARRPFCTTSSSFALSRRSRLSSRTSTTLFSPLILKCDNSWAPQYAQ